MATVPVYGRESEVSALEELIDAVERRGGTVVIRGEAGIGKSTLLEAASRSAAARGMEVLETSGVQSEAHLPFAGLHQLLQPLLAELGSLPPRQGDALEAAFGMGEAEPSDLFLIALATLDLLVESAERAPLLLVVEDAQWLDRSSSEVLAFVARRVRMEPMLLLIAVRDGSEDVFEAAQLQEMRLGPLDEQAAAELLRSNAADLDSSARERLLPVCCPRSADFV